MKLRFSVEWRSLFRSKRSRLERENATEKTIRLSIPLQLVSIIKNRGHLEKGR